MIILIDGDELLLKFSSKKDTIKIPSRAVPWTAATLLEPRDLSFNATSLTQGEVRHPLYVPLLSEGCQWRRRAKSEVLP